MKLHMQSKHPVFGKSVWFQTCFQNTFTAAHCNPLRKYNSAIKIATNYPQQAKSCKFPKLDNQQQNK